MTAERVSIVVMEATGDYWKPRQIQQLETLIESTASKYTSVATRILGVPGRKVS